MRVLFASIAEKTHFLGMVPLAWALLNAGHEVRVATQPEMVGTVTGAGLTAVPVGRDHALYRVTGMQRSLELDVELFDLAQDRPEELTWDRLRWGHRQVVGWWWRLVNEPMIDDLVAYARCWRPDLVVWEPISFAGPLAAEAVGAAHARFLWGADVFTRMRGHYLRVKAEQPADRREDVFQDWLTRRGAPYGVEYSERLLTGELTLDYVPESLRLPLDTRTQPIRYVPYNGTSVLPRWLWTPPERPRVCLTLGTAASERLGGFPLPVGDILRALGRQDVEVVATVPEALRPALGEVPANVRLENFVPLGQLVPTCSVVIHHGGNGSYQTCLLNGVPQLVLPSLFDAPLRAERLAAQGAGLVIPGAGATGGDVAAAVARLLAEPAFARAAAALRREVRDMPSPAEVAAALPGLLAASRRRDAAQASASASGSS
ncbi:glycosyltransferase (activator-dependent family) [Crossiella equi]|uniref:Glycosyltransferase (Activator-dependent family) n=1 Tax=Crossiella equi TaxID=130796 RepID=A0ABS5ABB9_9PSEU|nr:activator-dependent family glycosyltransferase [Crossiella equi]MBP2473499.1 glycosyltransferase (activator-dependent family) [Crossiella equi]